MADFTQNLPSYFPQTAAALGGMRSAVADAAAGGSYWPVAGQALRIGTLPGFVGADVVRGAIGAASPVALGLANTAYTAATGNNNLPLPDDFASVARGAGAAVKPEGSWTDPNSRPAASALPVATQQTPVTPPAAQPAPPNTAATAAIANVRAQGDRLLGVPGTSDGAPAAPAGNAGGWSITKTLRNADGSPGRTTSTTGMPSSAPAAVDPHPGWMRDPGAGWVRDPVAAITAGLQQQEEYRRRGIQEAMMAAREGGSYKYTERLGHLLNASGLNNFGALQEGAVNAANQSAAPVRSQSIASGTNLIDKAAELAQKEREFKATPRTIGAEPQYMEGPNGIKILTGSLPTMGLLDEPSGKAQYNALPTGRPQPKLKEGATGTHLGRPTVVKRGEVVYADQK